MHILIMSDLYTKYLYVHLDRLDITMSYFINLLELTCDEKGISDTQNLNSLYNQNVYDNINPDKFTVNNGEQNQINKRSRRSRRRMRRLSPLSFA